MIEVNRRGIERTHRAMGGEGTLVLALQTDQSPAVETLDAAIPLENGEGPANGGWFPGPRTWMLLVEGLDDVIYPWFDKLARRLDAAGVSGTLTGAGSVQTPAWSRGWPYEPHTLDAAYETGPGHRLWDSPGANEQLIRDLVDSTVDWLGADGARIRVGTQFSAHFWMDARATALMMRRESSRGETFSATGYHRARGWARHAHATEPGLLSLSTNGTGWEQAVADLRAALLRLPLDRLRVASISTHGSFIGYSPPDLADDDPDVHAYATHPETWGEFVAQPQGIQILTNDHLKQASDLTDWTTTRLDAGHVLVEARDLFPWYGAYRKYRPLPHRSPEWNKAREDFGDMMLSWSRATTLGIATPPKETF